MLIPILGRAAAVGPRRQGIACREQDFAVGQADHAAAYMGRNLLRLQSDDRPCIGQPILLHIEPVEDLEHIPGSPRNGRGFGWDRSYAVQVIQNDAIVDAAAQAGQGRRQAKCRD